MYTCTITHHLDGGEIIYYNPFETKFIEQELIFFGAKSVPCLFMPKENLSHTLEVGQDIIDALHLPINSQLHLMLDENNAYLGPLLGILTTGFTDACDYPLGARTDFFRKILQLQKDMYAIAYLFGPQHIHWREGFIEALMYKDNQWINCQMNFPTIIYDRLPNRKVEQARPIIRMKQKFREEYGIPIFNPGFFHKKEIYDCLQANTDTASFIPKTIFNPSYREIYHLLHTNSCIFFKPQNGSLGTGIVKCAYHPMTQMYYANYYHEQKKATRKFDQLPTLLEQTLPNIKTEPYCIQRGISLLKDNGRPFDFRVHTNRDSSGNWKVSAIAVKVAAYGAPTTHTKYGGKITVLEALPFPLENIERWRKQLIQTAIQMSQTIEKIYDGYIGEIGFDFGIDQEEKLWVFEGNAKPGRSIFSHPTLANMEQKNLSFTFQFACYLMEESIAYPTKIWETK